MTAEPDLFGEPTLADAEARGRVARTLGKPCNAPAGYNRPFVAAWATGWCKQDVEICERRGAAP